MRRFYKTACLALGAALLAASGSVALTGPSFVSFLISSLLLGAGWNLMILAGTTLLSQATSAQEAPLAQPLMEWTNNGCAAAMSFSCGILIQTLGWQAVNSLGLLVLAALALLMWRNRGATASAAPPV